MAEDLDPEGSAPHAIERDTAPEEADANVRGRVIGLPVPRAPKRRDGVGRTLWWDDEVTHQRNRDADWMKQTDVMAKTPVQGEVDKETTPREDPRPSEPDEPLAFDDLTGPMTAFASGLRLAPKDLDLDAVSFVSAVMVPPEEPSAGEADAPASQAGAADAPPSQAGAADAPASQAGAADAPESRPRLSFEDKTVVGYIDPVAASGPRPRAARVAAVLREVSEELAREDEPLFAPVEATKVMDQPDEGADVSVHRVVEVDAPATEPVAVPARLASPPPPTSVVMAPPVVPAPAPVPADLAVSTAPPLVSSQQPPPAKASWAGRLALMIVLLAVVGGGAFVGYRTWWTRGELVVRLKTADGSPVEKAEVFVDGRKVCDTDPCRITELKTGVRTVRVIAPGVAPQVTEAEVLRESTTEVWVELPVAPARLALQGETDVTVSIDGEDYGQLPLAVSLPPGRHELSLSAPHRLTVRKVVELVAGETTDLGRIDVPAEPPRLKLDLATKGAHVVLIPRHQADKIVVSGPFPRELELPPGAYDLVASKVHYRTFHRRVDTTIEPRLSVVVTLTPLPREKSKPGDDTEYEKPEAAPEPEAPEAVPSEGEVVPPEGEPVPPEAGVGPEAAGEEGTAEGQNLPATEPGASVEANPYD